MIQKINTTITAQRNGTTDSESIYIIDYKNINGGKVEILDIEPSDHFVHLQNDNKVQVYWVAFEDNALKVDRPEGQVKQCECVLFPTSLNNDDWMLFVETKYAYNFKIAMDEKVDYPNTMIAQIVSAVGYFREKEIIPNDKKVHAIVSFPPLVEEFGEAFFTRSNLTIEELAVNHKILLRPTNNGVIKSSKKIKL